MSDSTAKCWINGCTADAFPANGEGLCQSCHREREYEGACESAEAQRTTDQDFRDYPED